MDLRQVTFNLKTQVLDLGTFTKSVNISDVETCVLEYRVPQGKVLWLPKGGIYDLRLVTKESFTLQSGSGRSNYSATLTNKIVDQPSYPMDGGDCVAYWRGSRTSVEDIDYVLNTVTASVDDNAGTLELYYVFGNGYVKWYAEPPLGVDVARYLIANESLWITHSRSHLDEKSIPRLTRNVFLPEKWTLKIYVKSPAIVSWDVKAINAFLRLHCAFLPKTAFTPAELYKMARI